MTAARSKPARPRKPAAAPLASLAQMRALAHPLRLQLLELFALAPRTTKQAAIVLGQPPTRLYHHVAALERVGLVRLRSTKRNRGTIEKHFEAVAPLMKLDESRLGATARGYAAPAGPAAQHMAHTFFAEAQAEFNAAILADTHRQPVARPMAMRVAVYATRAQVAQLQRTWLAALRKLRGSHGAGGAAPSPFDERWTLTAVIVPAPLGPPARAPAKPAPKRPRTR